jgi:probable HAF family extracellular repeat protein
MTGTMISLGSMDTAGGINDSGEVVGYSDSAALLYSGGKIIDLGRLGGSAYGKDSRAYAINSYGQVVGISNVNNVNNHAFLWTPTTPQGSRRDGGRDSE